MRFIVFLLLFLPFSLKAQQLNEHTVVSGETIHSIAKKYGITSSELKQVNSGLDDYVVAGMVLKIPSDIKKNMEAELIWGLADDLKDVIYMKDGSELVAKISSISTDSIFFEQYNTDDLFSIPILKVTSVTFEDGSIKSFPELKPKAVKKPTTIKKRK